MRVIANGPVSDMGQGLEFNIWVRWYLSAVCGSILRDALRAPQVCLFESVYSLFVCIGREPLSMGVVTPMDRSRT